MSDSPAVRIRDLTVRYKDYLAVDRLDLEIPRGQLFGLLGPNGAGKSSTLRVLIGQRRPTSGTAEVLGRDVVAQWAEVKPLFGYVPDRENHFDDFTGRRNLEFYAGLYDVPKGRVEEMLSLVELDEAADRAVRGYSMGMRRKLMLARALLHDPPVLYLDEPTANLDLHSTDLVHRILKNRVKAGHAVIMTTHNMKDVEHLCDRVGILVRGRLIALDNPDVLRREHAESLVDVTLSDGRKIVIDLGIEGDRESLADLTRTGRVATVHTREFDFHTTFLKLTGQAGG